MSRGFLALRGGVFLKELEFPAVYDTHSDELYEVDPEGFNELAKCDGTLPAGSSAFPRSFLRFCLEEGLLELLASPSLRRVPVGRNETPSLRYLLLEVTERCNLDCRHCYLGNAGERDLPLELLRTVAGQFADIGGLRLMTSGGEPLLYPGFGEINDLMHELPFRTVLMTNGTLLTDELCASLGFDEVQVSLDGMKAGHDRLRREGSFALALKGIESLRGAGRQVSVATMVHLGNLAELDELGALVRSLGAVSWTLDVPCEAGRLSGEAASELLPEELGAVAKALEMAFGSEQHVPSGGYACGAHLACVKANGVLAKCGFYGDNWSGGEVSRGLRESWRALPKIRLEELDCRCGFKDECGGGCRFRAEAKYGRAGPDPLKCVLFGVSPPGG